MKNALLLLYLIYFQSQIFGQNQDFLNYTYGDDIKDIAFQNGTAWIATTGGLVVYDPMTDESTFMNRSNEGLPLNHINSIKFDENGTLYVGTQIGLAINDGQEWNLKNPPYDGNPDSYRQAFRAIEFDDDGNAWLLGREGHLWKFDGLNWTRFDEEALFGGNLQKLKKAPNGTMWVSRYSSEFGLFRINETQIEEVNLPVDEPNEIDDWTFSPNGELWFLYDAHFLGKPNGNTWELEETNHYGYNLTVGENEEIWLGIHHKKTDGSWESFGFTSSGIRKTVLTEDGSAWICSESGLSKVHNGQIQKIQTSNSGLAGNTIVDFAIIGQQTVYAGIGDYYVWHWDNPARNLSLFSNTKWTTLDYAPHIHDMDIDPTGLLWGLKENFLYNFKNDIWTSYEYNGYVGSMDIHPITGEI